ncbi:MAG: hypothetical protein ABIH23_24390 [bacterium]
MTIEIPLTFGFIQAIIPWIPAIAGALGIGSSLYGANKQEKAQSASDAANRAAVAEQDRNSWVNYLMQRGLYQPNAATGTIPGATPGAPMNTRLPLWASGNFASPTGGTRWVKRGTVNRASGSTPILPFNGNPAR